MIERLDVSGVKPLILGDAIAFASQVEADEGDALLAIERLAQAVAMERIFLDMSQDPPTPISWDEVLVRLGGRDGLAGEAWREGARTIAVHWVPPEGRRR